MVDQGLKVLRVDRVIIPDLVGRVAHQIEVLTSVTAFSSDVRFGSLSDAQVMLAHAVKAVFATRNLDASDRVSILTLTGTALHGTVTGEKCESSVRQQARIMRDLVIRIREAIADLALLELNIGTAETAEGMMRVDDEREETLREEAAAHWRQARRHQDSVMRFLASE